MPTGSWSDFANDTEHETRIRSAFEINEDVKYRRHDTRDFLGGGGLKREREPDAYVVSDILGEG